MALKACRECGHEISTQAETCPHCGAKNKPMSIVGWLGVIVAAFIGFSLFIGHVRSAHQTQTPSEPASAQAASIYNSAVPAAPPSIPTKLVEEVAKIPEKRFCLTWGELTRRDSKKGSDYLRAVQNRAVQDFNSPTTADQDQAILHREAEIGMTECMALAAVGRPEDINRTVFTDHVHEQWVYGNGYLYFDDGKLTSFQD